MAVSPLLLHLLLTCFHFGNQWLSPTKIGSTDHYNKPVLLWRRDKDNISSCTIHLLNRLHFIDYYYSSLSGFPFRLCPCLSLWLVCFLFNPCCHIMSEWWCLLPQKWIPKLEPRIFLFYSQNLNNIENFDFSHKSL